MKKAPGKGAFLLPEKAGAFECFRASRFASRCCTPLFALRGEGRSEGPVEGPGMLRGACFARCAGRSVEQGKRLTAAPVVSSPGRFGAGYFLSTMKSCM